MRILAPLCIFSVVAVPAVAQDFSRVIDLLPGHPVHQESMAKAGVVMALSIRPGQDGATDLQELCEELGGAAGLERENGHGHRLEVIFVSPYKEMAVEGYYLPGAGTAGAGELVRGDRITRAVLDGIVARAGIPTTILEEVDVEQQISCELAEPVWHLRWDDVRSVDGLAPDNVIEHAYRRFMAVHERVVEYNAKGRYLEKKVGQKAPVSALTSG